jgi:hypothetical protein
VSTLRAVTLDTVSTIKNSASTTVLTTNTSEPLLTVGTGANLIKARNTAKFWLQCSNYNSIATSYNIASVVDEGGSSLRVNYVISATSTYAIAISWSHWFAVTWQLLANYPGAPQPSYFTLRFHSTYSGTAGNPGGGWGAIGFGDQS